MNSNIFFRKQNYILIGAGVLITVIAYVVMAGGGSGGDPNVHNPDLFSFRHITLAPFLWFIGTLLILVGIMKKFGEDEIIEDELDLTSPKKK